MLPNLIDRAATRRCVVGDDLDHVEHVALDRRGRILAVGAPHGVDLRVESHGFVNTDEPGRHLSATIVAVARKFADVLVQRPEELALRSVGRT